MTFAAEASWSTSTSMLVAGLARRYQGLAFMRAWRTEKAEDFSSRMSSRSCQVRSLPVSSSKKITTLVSDFNNVFEAIIAALHSIADWQYQVAWDLRNTQIHGGAPPKPRPRLRGRDQEVKVEAPISIAPTYYLCALGFAIVQHDGIPGQLCLCVHFHEGERVGDSREDH